MNKEYKYKMSEGEKLNRSPNQPALFVVSAGKRSYIWVGNNASNDMACFGTISGEGNLRRIANAITKALKQS